MNPIVILIGIGLAVAPFVVVIQTVGWAIGQSTFPGGISWVAAAIGTVFWVAAVRSSNDEPARPLATKPKPPTRAEPKRYVMRGYGGGKNATSVHPRQQKLGRTVVYIPGVGFRHVQRRRKK